LYPNVLSKSLYCFLACSLVRKCLQPQIQEKKKTKKWGREKKIKQWKQYSKNSPESELQLFPSISYPKMSLAVYTHIQISGSPVILLIIIYLLVLVSRHTLCFWTDLKSENNFCFPGGRYTLLSFSSPLPLELRLVPLNLRLLG